MDEELDFHTFLNNRLKDHGMSIKKLAELTGIAAKHLEHLSDGQYDKLPPAPYVHGYLLRIGSILQFDPTIWWERVRVMRAMPVSGSHDALPKNRYAKGQTGKIITVIAVLLAVGLYFVFRSATILGTPRITIISPAQNPATVSEDTISIEGTSEQADEVTMNNEKLLLDKSGAWQKNVLLQAGLNTFEVKARKFLGREAIRVLTITYEPPPLAPVAPEKSKPNEHSNSSPSKATSTSP